MQQRYLFKTLVHGALTPLEMCANVTAGCSVLHQSQFEFFTDGTFV